MKTMKASAIVPVVLVIMSAVACSSAPQQSTAPVNVHPVSQATPPPITTTPVPIVHAHAVASAGRPDPFVTLFGPPTGGGNPAPTKVAVSNFPNIPTLPGFENAPGAKDLWSGVKLTGVVDHGGRIAIVEADGKSYFVRPGDRVDDKFTVLSIGPDFITLGTEKEERHFSLGG